MVRWKISVEQRGLERKMRNLRRKLVKGSLKTVKELVEYGKMRAKFLVPYDTGATFRSIRGQTFTQESGASGRIFIEPGQPANTWGQNGAQTTEELVLIMHKWSGARRHFSNDPRFMYTVRKELNQRKRNTASKAFDGLNIK